MGVPRTWLAASLVLGAASRLVGQAPPLDPVGLPGQQLHDRFPGAGRDRRRRRWLVHRELDGQLPRRLGLSDRRANLPAARSGRRRHPRQHVHAGPAAGVFGGAPRRRRLCRRLGQQRAGWLGHRRVRAAVRRLPPSPVGSEFRVNVATNGDQYNPQRRLGRGRQFCRRLGRVSVRAAGLELRLRTEIRQGRGRVGLEFQVATPRNHQAKPQVAANRDGFLVVWTAFNGNAAGRNGIYGQQFDASWGKSRTTSSCFPTYTAGAQGNPAIASGPAGSYVVVWESSVDHNAGGSHPIYGQRFDASLTRVGPEFPVSPENGDQIRTAEHRRGRRARQDARGLEVRDGGRISTSAARSWTPPDRSSVRRSSSTPTRPDISCCRAPRATARASSPSGRAEARTAPPRGSSAAARRSRLSRRASTPMPPTARRPTETASSSRERPSSSSPPGSGRSS